MLQDAVDWCYNHGLKFDAVNDNLEENKEHFGNNTRKVFADEYWDDKAVPVVAGYNPLAGQIFFINSEEPQRKSLFARIKEVFSRWGT